MEQLWEVPMRALKRYIFLYCTLLLVLPPCMLAAQTHGTIKGMVVDAQQEPVHHARVLVVQTGEAVETDHEGMYRIESIPAGTYDIFAEAASFASPAKRITVVPGGTAKADLTLVLSPIRYEVTVTARGRHQTTFEAIETVTTLDSFAVSEKMAVSVGEVLDGELGIAKRSFGPGSARPVIRGFDGDRVLVVADGMRVGSLGSQSGDHGEPIDPSNVERLEVLKGPATLLYGSNAIGGVVNAISRHHEMHKHRHEGIRGQVSSSVGSNNGLAGGSATAEWGTGNFMLWGGGGGQRAGDYSSPEGTVENSKAWVTNASAGMGWFGDHAYLSFGYSYRKGRNGIPGANELHSHEHGEHNEEGEHDHEDEHEDLEAIDVAWNYHNARISGGFQNIDSPIENIRLGINFSRWKHNELEIQHGNIEEIGTAFDNRQFTLRGDFDQQKRGILTGSFGVWGIFRDYSATGIEALSPPVDQRGFAFFVLEEFNFERVRFQLGGRIEHMRYKPTAAVERPHDHDHDGDHDDDHENGESVLLPELDFTGFSGSAGMRLRLWEKGAFVAHFTSSYRPPALEELYNYGPHVGNLAFEIGNPNLTSERSNGFELSLRHADDRIEAQAGFFYYQIDSFIYPAPTGEVENGLFVVEYDQGNSRFLGSELGLKLGLNEIIWLDLGMDIVNAKLTGSDTPLPRIPPLRGKVGLDLRFDNLSIRPELVMANSQKKIFSTETPTAGYGVVNLKASYTIPRQHFVHNLSVDVFNIGDKLYRNHVSLIKELAPEMGRGIRFGYALKFF
jgi:iron complex outermembrane receptor protein